MGPGAAAPRGARAAEGERAPGRVAEVAAAAEDAPDPTDVAVAPAIGARCRAGGVREPGAEAWQVDGAPTRLVHGRRGTRR